MTIVDPEAYAATEPVMASEQSAAGAARGRRHRRTRPPRVRTVARARDDAARARRTPSATAPSSTRARPSTTAPPSTGADEHAPAEAGAAVADTDDTGPQRGRRGQEQPTEERYDPTPDPRLGRRRGRAARGDPRPGRPRSRPSAPTSPRSSDDATSATADGRRRHGIRHHGIRRRQDATAADDASDATASGESVSTGTEGRRISGFDELRDGGFGVGSAAPLDDGAQPLDHPVQAYRDTMTYRAAGRRRLRLGRAARLVLRRGRRRAQRLPSLGGLTPACSSFSLHAF